MSEFDQIQVRESEIKELEDIMGRVPCEVKVLYFLRMLGFRSDLTFSEWYGHLFWKSQHFVARFYLEGGS